MSIKRQFWLSIITNMLKYLAFFSIISSTPLALGEIRRASQIVEIKGKKVMFQEGQKRRFSAETGQQLKNKNQKLIVPGNNHDLARLILLGDNNAYIEILLQAGPDFDETLYQFPCTLKNGTLTVGWIKNKNRGCEDGMRLSPQNTNHNNTKQNNTKQNTIAQSSQRVKQEVIIKPNQSESILCQVYNQEDQQIIKSLLGNLFVITPNNPQGIILKENEEWRYDYQTQKETINTIDRKKILDSEELQDFLDPSNWDSNSISAENYSQVKKHLEYLSKNQRNNSEVQNFKYEGRY